MGGLCSDVCARLLVVGDRRRASLLSTPVERIAWGASVPLLVVRDLERFRAWTRGERPLTVLLGIKSTSAAPPVRDWLAWLAAAGPLDVLVAQIWDPAQEHGRNGTDAQAEIRRHDLRATLVGLAPQVTSRVHLEARRDGVGELLSRLAARERVDLMVLGGHPRKDCLLAVPRSHTTCFITHRRRWPWCPAVQRSPSRTCHAPRPLRLAPCGSGCAGAPSVDHEDGRLSPSF